MTRGLTILSSEETNIFLKSLLTFVEKCKSKMKSLFPFIFLESSSGLGKTQMAFAMIQFCQEQEYQIHYLVSQIHEGSQEIYQAYSNRINTFNLCCGKDLLFLREMNLNVGVQSLENQSLYTFGFLCALLQGYVISSSYNI